MESNVSKQKFNNDMALIGFVMSFFQPIVGLILSIIGMNQIKKTGEEGKGFALAGIIISAISLAFLLILCVFYVIVIFAALAAA